MHFLLAESFINRTSLDSNFYNIPNFEETDIVEALKSLGVKPNIGINFKDRLNCVAYFKTSLF